MRESECNDKFLCGNSDTFFPLTWCSLEVFPPHFSAVLVTLCVEFDAVNTKG